MKNERVNFHLKLLRFFDVFLWKMENKNYEISFVVVTGTDGVTVGNVLWKSSAGCQRTCWRRMTSCRIMAWQRISFNFLLDWFSIHLLSNYFRFQKPPPPWHRLKKINIMKNEPLSLPPVRLTTPRFITEYSFHLSLDWRFSPKNNFNDNFNLLRFKIPKKESHFNLNFPHYYNEISLFIVTLKSWRKSKYIFDNQLICICRLSADDEGDCRANQWLAEDVKATGMAIDASACNCSCKGRARRRSSHEQNDEKRTNRTKSDLLSIKRIEIILRNVM